MRLSLALRLYSSLVDAIQGQKVLLRISNLNITNTYTLATNGLEDESGWCGCPITPRTSRLGKDLYFETNSITLGGGESTDVIIDTAGVAAGTYFLYTSNLNYLNNNNDDFGGMMTEIHVNAI